MTNHTPDAAVEARIDARIHEQLDYWIAQLARLCAQPSISAQRRARAGLARLRRSHRRSREVVTEELTQRR